MRDFVMRHKIIFDNQIDNPEQAQSDFKKKILTHTKRHNLIAYTSHIHQLRDGESDDNVYRIKTFHNTFVFLDPDDNLIHQSWNSNLKDMVPVYARRVDDALSMFVIRDNREIHFTIDGATVEKHDKPTPFKPLINPDGSFSVVRGKEYLCAWKDDGRCILTPRNVTWEHFILERRCNY